MRVARTRAALPSGVAAGPKLTENLMYQCGAARPAKLQHSIEKALVATGSLNRANQWL